MPSVPLPHGTILLVDDEAKIRELLASALTEEGHEVVATGSPRVARQWLGQRFFDVLIVDNLMPEMTGLELIREFTSSVAESERPQILLMTAHATVESAIAAMKLGALDYLQKPFEIDELLVVVSRAVEHQRLRTHHGYLLAERDEEFDHYGIVGRSRVMQEVIHTADLVAQTKSTVLITGETGTGKELVARAIHARSAERDRPLIKVNCAAIPETLLESELFGHVKGAFTGATANKKGRFCAGRRRDHLPRRDRHDEPGAPGQAAACAAGARVRAARIGAQPESRRPRHRRDQPRPAAAGRRRPVPGGPVLPPQRDPGRRFRRCAIGGRTSRCSSDHLVRKHAQRAGRVIDRIDDGLVARLTAYDWPGNVRELENTIERAVVLSPARTLSAQALFLPGRGDVQRGERAVAQPAPEPRMVGEGDRAPRARGVPRRQERCGRAHGYQPARTELLPRQASHRLVARAFPPP